MTLYELAVAMVRDADRIRTHHRAGKIPSNTITRSHTLHCELWDEVKAVQKSVIIPGEKGVLL